MNSFSEEPIVSVGIMHNTKIQFELFGMFKANDSQYTGISSVSIINEKISYLGSLYNELLFSPLEENAFFELKEVVIGIDFHWERTENQRFSGALKLIVDGSLIQVLNLISVERYLTSVISSEMSATSSIELLKAHAIISRSWLLDKISHIQKEKYNSNQIFYSHGDKHDGKHSDTHDNVSKIVRWHDQQDHTLFDVCADDHCQRYQGITKSSTSAVYDAIQATYGMVLTYENKICDARFYKSCGGATELFENCWEPVHHGYLLPVADSEMTKLPDLTNEEEASKWILSSPKSFCNTKEMKILSQVLNNYDQETPDFYRWTVRYSQSELSSLIKEKSGYDFGLITSLKPLKRGSSGRIIELEIVGEKKSMIVGKELEIRKWLSSSHLYSSAFVVSRDEKDFVLNGAGWGHGVGLCQIGAAVMADMGYGYQQILSHYYPNANIEKYYTKDREK